VAKARILLGDPDLDGHGGMSVLPREQLGRTGSDHELRDKALLQCAVTEAFALLNAGKGQEAVGQIVAYADVAAQSSAGCYVFGLVHFNAGKLCDALSWFNRAVALQPAFLDALSALAVVHQRLGQPQEALKSFEAVLKLRPDDVETLFSVGVVLQSLGRIADALAAYEEALRLNPSHCGALTNQGALLERFGRLNDALACFDAIAALTPEDSANLFNRGSVLHKLGRHKDALAAYEEAARRGPPDADTQLNRGNVLQRLGRLEEALAAYDLASQYRNGYPQALYNKGIALQALFRPLEALAAYDAALALDPSHYEASCNRGNALHELGRDEEALGACTYTLRIRPGFLPALANRANILLQMGRAEEAVLSCDEVLRQTRAHPQCLCIRGAALQKCGRLEEALATLEEAISLNPNAPEAWVNEGNVLQELNRHREAIPCYQQALRLKSHYAEALSGRGVALKELGRIDEALASFEAALKIKPDYPDARNNRAGVLLLKGSLREGFADFESRWDRTNAPTKTLLSDLPQWDGQELTGRKILVWDEQGLGDLIQFSRYLLSLVAAGADVILLCRKNMHRLLTSLPAPIRLVDTANPHESFDFQCALMSLPYGFRTSLDTIPAPTPYLRPDPNLVAKWADRIGARGFRIGIAWHGNKFVNLQRSIPLACFARLAAIAGVRLLSLMKDQAQIDVESPGGRLTIEHMGDDFDQGPGSFMDCAAVMENCELIVTSDTSIAHLAGALGRPVFVALKSVPDWRWLLDRDDCPWYPSMRLFRQAAKGDWDSVFKKIAAATEARLAKKSREPARTIQASPTVAIPSSAGELIDKIAILEIKESRIADAEKLAHIRHELSLLLSRKAECKFAGEELARLSAELKLVNSLLWDAEAEIRAHEARGDFGESFVALARQIYATNDHRAALKKAINQLLNSEIVEVKSY
jgi:tetratricopeptide (TPR) repeat protein